MSTTGWILMVGLRVVDLGALVVWLIWFYRQCDQDDDETDGRDDFGRSDEPEVPPAPTGGLGVPLPDAQPWPSRRREHGDRTWPPPAPVRRAPDRHREPVRLPEPV